MKDDNLLEKRNEFYVHRSYPNYYGCEDVYNLDQIRQKFYWIESKSYYKKDCCLNDILRKYCKPICQNNTTYYLKDHIDMFVDMKANLINLDDILKETHYTSKTSLHSFINRNNIKICVPRTIPFFVHSSIKKQQYGILLELIKQKGKPDRIKTKVKKEYPIYEGQEEVYNLNEIRERLTWIESEGYTKRDYRMCDALNNFSKPIKKNRTTYYLQEDIEKFVEMKEKIIDLNHLLSMSTFSEKKYLINALRKDGIQVFIHPVIPFFTESYILKCDYKRVLDVINKNDMKKFRDKYYSLRETAEYLGIYNTTKSAKRIAKYCKYTRRANSQWWYLKKDVDFYKNIKNKTVNLDDICKEIGVSKQTCLNIFKESGFEYFSPSEFPFGGSTRVYQKDVNYFKKIYTLRKEYTIADKHKKYDLLKEMLSCERNLKIEQTLNDLDEYIEKKLNNTEGDATIARYCNSGGKLYAFFNRSLSRDLKYFHTYQEDTQLHTDSIDNVFKVFLMDEKNTTADFVVLVRFYNFLIDKYSLERKCKKIKTSDKELYDMGKLNVEPYSHEQFIELFDVIFNQIYESKFFFEKIRSNKKMANSCLYMALHFCLGWRRSDIVKIEHPDLIIIGFSTGKDFLEFLTEPAKFTQDMGYAICNNVKTLVEGLGRTTSKTGEDLVIEIGRTLVKPIGMMLAICEAYRILDNEKYIIKKSTIARNNNFVALLGYKYREIFGEESFSNRRANKAYMNYLVAKSDEENNGIGYMIAALVRSHRLNENLIPISTQNYINREVDKDVSAAAIELWHTGGFGFVKYQMLSLLQEDFGKKRLAEKRAEVRNISVTPLGVYDISKTLNNQSKVNKEITKNIIKNLHENKVLFKDTILNLTKSRSTGKHKDVKCLLRAMPLEAILQLEKEKSFEDMARVNKESDICMYPEVSHCDGCPMLIAQIYYIFELKNKMNDVLENINISTDKFDIVLLNKIFVEGYTPILDGIIEEIGSKSVNAIINLEELQKKVFELQAKNKLVLG